MHNAEIFAVEHDDGSFLGVARNVYGEGYDFVTGDSSGAPAMQCTISHSAMWDLYTAIGQALTYCPPATKGRVDIRIHDSGDIT